MNLKVGAIGGSNAREPGNRPIGRNREPGGVVEVDARQVFRLFGPPSRSLPLIEAAAVSAVTVPKTRNSGVVYGRFVFGAAGGSGSLDIWTSGMRPQLTACPQRGQCALPCAARLALP